MTIDVERLAAACGDMSGEAGIKIQTLLEPLGGVGTTVKPAIYPGPAFQEDWRWWDEPPVKTRAIVIDNTRARRTAWRPRWSCSASRSGCPRWFSISRWCPVFPRTCRGGSPASGFRTGKQTRTSATR